MLTEFCFRKSLPKRTNARSRCCLKIKQFCEIDWSTPFSSLTFMVKERRPRTASGFEWLAELILNHTDWSNWFVFIFNFCQILKGTREYVDPVSKIALVLKL